MSDQENALHAADGGLEIGPMLEQARKDRGLSLAEVEQATKIRKRYLQCLERDDYGALPDAIYARGFLKTYANYLGLDGETLAWQLKNRRAPRRERHGGGGPASPRGDFDRPLISPGGLSGTGSHRVSSATILALIVGLFAVSAVIGTLYFIGRGSGTASEDPVPVERAADEGARDEAAPAGDTPEEQAPDAAAAEEEEAASPQTPPAPETLRAVVSVEGAPSWIQIQSDGQIALEQVAEPGFSQTFEAEETFTIYTGNAGAVSVEINGQDLGTLGENGEVLSRDFNLKSGT